MTNLFRFALWCAVFASTVGATLDAQELLDESCPECLGPAPKPELNPGWNLYWDDPCNVGLQPLPLGCGYLQNCGAAPKFYVTADFAPLMRDQARTVIFQTLGSSTASVLDTDNFSTGFQPGGKATIGRSIGDWYRLEGTFWGGYQWNDFVSARDATTNNQGGAGSMRSPFSNFGNPAIVAGLDNNDLATIGIRSQLNGVELNARRRLVMPRDRIVASEASFLVGIRYMNVNENFNYFSHSNGTGAQNVTNQYNVGASNNLLGPQIGFMSQVMVRENSWFDLEAKGAILANDAGQISNYTNNNNGVVTQFGNNWDQTKTSFMGDFAVTLNHQISRRFTFRLGYNALVINGLSLGSTNVNRNLNFLQNGPPSVNTQGRMVYHGPFLGLTWNF